MDNPYAPSSLRAEPTADSRQRRPVWKSLLIAYAVHHVSSLLGFVLGLIVGGGRFPSDQPGFAVAILFLLPLWMDVRTLAEPFFLDVVPPLVTVFRLIRCVLVLTLPVAGGAYLWTQWRHCLWYLGIVSFLLGLMLFITISGPW